MKLFYDLLSKKLPKRLFYQYIIFFILITIVSVSSHLILELLNVGSIKEVTEERSVDNRFILFFSMVLFAPFFETFLFQWIPVFVYTSIRKNVKYDLFMVLIFGVLFGVFHSYNLGYSIAASIVGAFYILIALYYSRINKNFFIPVLVVHLLNNSFAFLKYI